MATSKLFHVSAAIAMACVISGCGAAARLPVSAGTGPAPALPPRPVGVAIDKHGALLVANDVGNVVWRVSGG